jgi:hypothetical protein
MRNAAQNTEFILKVSEMVCRDQFEAHLRLAIRKLGIERALHAYAEVADDVIKRASEGEEM